MLATLRLLLFLFTVTKVCVGFHENETNYEDLAAIIKCATTPDTCEYEDTSRCSIIQNCTRGFDSCFMAWQSFNGSKDILKHQGCWTSNLLFKCATAECKQDPSISTLDFCCCNTDLCNRNYTVVPRPEISPEDSTLPDIKQENNENRTSILSIVPITAFVIIIVFVFCMWISYYTERYGHQQMPTADPELITPPVQLAELRAHGEVWKDTVETNLVQRDMMNCL